MAFDGKPPVRAHDDQVATWPEHPMDLSQRFLFIGHVLQDFIDECAIERIIREFKPGSVKDLEARVRYLARDGLLDPLFRDINSYYGAGTITEQRSNVSAFGTPEIKPAAGQVRGDPPHAVRDVSRGRGVSARSRLAYWHDGLPVIQMAATSLALISISFCSLCCNLAVISTCWALWLRNVHAGGWRTDPAAACSVPATAICAVNRAIEPALVTSRPGQVLIGDKNYYGTAFEAALAAAGIRLLRPARKGEPEPAGTRFFKPLRQIIESVKTPSMGTWT